jgi:hypothetical protein
MQCDRCGERLIEIDRYASNAIDGVASKAPLLSNYPSKISRRFEELRSMVGRRVQFATDKTTGVTVMPQC